MRILFGTCHYNDSESILAFVRHITPLVTATEDQFSLSVADNSQNWPAEHAMPAWFRTVDAGGNVGYLSGAHRCFDIWREEHGDVPDVFGIVNHDMTLPPNFFAGLREAAALPDVGLFGPRIFLTSGAPQNPYFRKRPTRRAILLRRFISSNRFLWSLWDRTHSAKGWFRARRAAGADSTAPTGDFEDIYAVHGAAMYLTRRFFERGGELAYEPFFGGEEIHLAEQNRRCGLRAVLANTLTLRHNEHTTISRLGRLKRHVWLRENMAYLYKRYFSARP